MIFPQLFLCIAQDLRHKAPKSCEYTREFDYTPVAYTWQFWTQGNRTVQTAHCALMYHIYHGNDNTFNNRQTGGYFFRFSLSPRPSSATMLALNQFSMINAIQGKLNSTRQCNAILGRGNFCIVSLAFVSSFSPVGIVLKVGERARSSQTAPAFDSPAPPPTRIRNNKRHNYPLLLGGGISESGRQR